MWKGKIIQEVKKMKYLGYVIKQNERQGAQMYQRTEQNGSGNTETGVGNGKANVESGLGKKSIAS